MRQNDLDLLVQVFAAPLQLMVTIAFAVSTTICTGWWRSRGWSRPFSGRSSALVSPGWRHLIVLEPKRVLLMAGSGLLMGLLAVLLPARLVGWLQLCKLNM